MPDDSLRTLIEQFEAELENLLLLSLYRLEQSMRRSVREMTMQSYPEIRRQWIGSNKPTNWKCRWFTIGKQREWGDFTLVPMASYTWDGVRTSRSSNMPWPYTSDGDFNIEYELTVDRLRRIRGFQPMLLDRP